MQTTSQTLHSHMPDTARVWIFQSNRLFTAQETAFIESATKEFIAQWNAHKQAVHGEGHVLFNAFVVLIADENYTAVSGCSMDSMVHFIRSLQSRFALNFFDRLSVAYLTPENQLKFTTAREIGSLLDKGELNENTLVFNNLISSKKELEENWILPLGKSWLKNHALQIESGIPPL